ncbi:alpha/beta hydrolase, partial [bacterium]|nr:alpha/beta hydrolase [bacterium]
MKTYEKNSSAIIISLVLIIMAITHITPIQAQTLSNEEIEGIWQGVIKSSEFELGIVFTIYRDPDNTLTAAMDVPEQNATDIPVDKVIFDGNNVHLEITAIEGVFNGKLTKDGETIDGQWSQGGMSLALVLKRSDIKFVIKRPQEPKEPFSYAVEEIVFKNTDANITLAGTLTFPHSEGTFPAVLLLSGSGPQDRDEAVFGHRPFWVLADYLTRKGIAVLRVDDRGVGGSTGDFDNVTAIDFTADAKAGVNYLKSRKEINHERIGLIGHSEGG